MRLKAGRKTVERGGHGVARELQTMTNAPDVFWSTNHNSFVCVEDAGRFKILSINGIGEIRWPVDDWMKDPESVAARNYFLEEGPVVVLPSKPDLQQGQTFETAGYELAAHMTAAQGGGIPLRQVVTVYHNNSSHYLVAYQEALDSKTAVFLKAFPYWNVADDPSLDEQEVEQRMQEIYKAALTEAIGWAMRF